MLIGVSETEDKEPHGKSGKLIQVEQGGYEPPAFEVLSLNCEISGYAPDEDTPLF